MMRKMVGHPRVLFTDQQLIELHKKGMNDREISEKLGVSFGIVSFHRNKLGLKPVRKHRNKDYKRKRLFTDQQLIELHAQGFNDREISEKIGAHQNTVSVHRRRLGLKVHGHRIRRFTDQQLIELHAQGFNDRKVGEEFGVSRNAVCSRRRRLGIKPVSALHSTVESMNQQENLRQWKKFEPSLKYVELAQVDLSVPFRGRELLSIQGTLKIAYRWGVWKAVFIHWLLYGTFVGGTLYALSIWGIPFSTRYIVFYTFINSTIIAIMTYRKISKALCSCS